MTSEDGRSLSEEDMDEIVNKVVDQLRDAEVGGEPRDEDDGVEADADEHDIEVRVEDNEGAATEGGEGSDDEDGRRDDDRGDAADEAAAGPRERAERRREEAHERKREAKRRARDRADAFDDLGDRIEAAVEAQLDHVAEHIEHSLPGGPESSSAPTYPGVVVGPDDVREKAVYKTQLQKAGRVAVPDTEIEALDLAPGDTLQVVLYPLE